MCTAINHTVHRLYDALCRKRARLDSDYIHVGGIRGLNCMSACARARSYSIPKANIINLSMKSKTN